MNKWDKTIDQITQECIFQFGELSEDLLNWKPNQKSWSIAQNIDHLIKINQSYFPIIEDLKAGSYKPPFTAKMGFMVSLFGNMILKSVDPKNRKKVETFAIWQPGQSHFSKDILIVFQSHQNELKKQIKSCKEQIKNGDVIHSPANKNIVYKLETAFDIIVLHEQRHMQQAREILLIMDN